MGLSQEESGKLLGISRGAYQNRLRVLARMGLLGTAPVLPGFEISKTTAVLDEEGLVQREYVSQRPERGGEFELRPNQVIKGVSTLLDGQGNTVLEWIKTREERENVEQIIAAIKGAFDDVKPARRAAAPKRTASDLLNLIPCNDWHINLLVWGKEAGENWDLKIAEQVIGDGIVDTINRSPGAGTAIVLGGGDLLHADTNDNRTAKSGNILEADGRHQKGLEVAMRLMVRTIDAALSHNEHVIVRNLAGNHDEYSAVAVSYFLLAYYRSEPRVTVDVSPSLFFWHRFGEVMLGATHGHTVKLKDMAMVMAHRRAEDWGQTKFRYVHGFHIHHSSKFVTEGEGVIAESHQAPIPQDAWHHNSGYLSGRSFQTITYHKNLGEIGRVRTAILPALPDNEEAAA